MQVSELITRVRTLVNDETTYADGQPKPDVKYSDETILVEIKSALLLLRNKEPHAFYPNGVGAATVIDQLTAGSDMPVDGQFRPSIEARAAVTLESTTQEGARPAQVRTLQENLRDEAT